MPPTPQPKQKKRLSCSFTAKDPDPSECSASLCPGKGQAIMYLDRGLPVRFQRRGAYWSMVVRMGRLLLFVTIVCASRCLPASVWFVGHRASPAKVLRGGRFYLCANRFLFACGSLRWSKVFPTPRIGAVLGFQRLGMRLNDLNAQVRRYKTPDSDDIN